MKKTVIAVCAFGLAAAAAQAQGVARDFNEFGRMYRNSEQGQRITDTLEKANRQAASEHARQQQQPQEQQTQTHYFVPATGAMKDWAVYGNLCAQDASVTGNQAGTQGAVAKPKAKAKPAVKKGKGGNKSTAPAKHEAKQPASEKEKGFWDMFIESIASQNHVSTAAFK